MFFSILIQFGSSDVFLEEHFNNTWTSRWRKPDTVKKGYLLGKFRISPGRFFGNEQKQRGLETLDAHRSYLLYSNFTKQIDTRDRDLFIAYTLRIDVNLDCSGQYIKLYRSDISPESYNNETRYAIMFGPDYCGAKLHHLRIYINHEGVNYPVHPRLPIHKDALTHAYILKIRKNNTFEAWIDDIQLLQGKLSDHFDIPTVTEGPDLTAKMPQNWDEREFIEDPSSSKPSDWIDDEYIPDPDAFRPISWEDSMEWEPPKVKNPNFKGKWTPPIIKNPNFKGIWHPPIVKYNNAQPDPTFGYFPSLSFLGLEFYQNTPGSIFNNFIVTDDEEYLNKTLENVFFSIRRPELETLGKILENIKQKDQIERMKNYSPENDLSDSDDDDSYEPPMPNLDAQRKKEIKAFTDPKIHQQRKKAKNAEKDMLDSL